MKRILVREEYCFACRLCEIYCAVQHSRSKDIIKAYMKETPPRLSAELEWRKLGLYLSPCSAKTVKTRFASLPVSQAPYNWMKKPD